MKWKNISLKTRLNLIASIILLVGLGSACLIYVAAGNDEENGAGYELSNPQYFKRYMRDLELYGGKANVLAEEFRDWFTGLWHGKSLAFTVACITVLISLGLFVFARHLPSGLKPDPSEKDS
jgi:hypothetical protein